ncbi:hypothetical protein [Aurantimonas coralicida]|uniref:hypothetical protein n=1 Tax=Aurantimonas coralicida TaxID=182270 RepID=UPI001E4F623A|nr:hypothetical protein [Aurantimonas coralicida]MCD1645299.1 hypothetical protein [Aurantimonas coralicida]
MGETYTPTDEKIAEVIGKAGGDVRKLAVAYLRAQRRAVEAETAFALMGDIQDLTMAAMTGDVDRAGQVADRAHKRAAEGGEANG